MEALVGGGGEREGWRTDRRLWLWSRLGMTKDGTKKKVWDPEISQKWRYRKFPAKAWTKQCLKW